MPRVARSLLFSLVLLLVAGEANAHGGIGDWWIFWWAYNSEPVLDVRSKILDRRERTTAEEEMLRTRVAPTLARVANDAGLHPEIRGGAAIALARCPGGDAHLDTILALAGKPAPRVVSESAVIALGILGPRGPGARARLSELIARPTTEQRTRGLSAVGLGLIGDPDGTSFDFLAGRIGSGAEPPDFQVCAIAALGLLGDPEHVPEMLAWLDEGSIGESTLTDLTRANLVGAIGKMGDPAAIDAVTAELKNPGVKTRRSAAIALGRLIPAAAADEQRLHLARLLHRTADEKDRTARSLAWISTGRIAGAPETADGVRKAAVSSLLAAWKRAESGIERPYVALALGLSFSTGRGEPRTRRTAADRIRSALAAKGGKTVPRAAYALALGLLRDARPATVDLLLSILVDADVTRMRVRSSAAVALGLIGDPRAADALLLAAKDDRDRDFRQSVATAAGLLGADGVREYLTSVLDRPKNSQFVIGSVALALGRTADPRAIEKLMKIVEPGVPAGKYPDLTRALSVVAIGQIANHRTLPALSRVREDVNWQAVTPSLEELLCYL